MNWTKEKEKKKKEKKGTHLLGSLGQLAHKLVPVSFWLRSLRLLREREREREREGERGRGRGGGGERVCDRECVLVRERMRE